MLLQHDIERAELLMLLFIMDIASDHLDFLGAGLAAHHRVIILFTLVLWAVVEILIEALSCLLATGILVWILARGNTEGIDEGLLVRSDLFRIVYFKKEAAFLFSLSDRLIVMFGAEGGEGLGERIIESRVVRRVNAVLGLGDA